MTITTTHEPRRTAARLGRTIAVACGAAALVAAAPAAAQAHVGMSADTSAAGAYAVLTLAVPHGCEGSPTTRVSVRVPAGVNTAVPTVNQGWTVEKKQQKLEPPVTTPDGDQLTTRVSEIVWTAREPLLDGFRDTLSLQALIPDDATGELLVFPTIQTCEEGETAWTQVPASGQDEDDLEHPAPAVLVTPPSPEGHHGGAADADRPAPAAAAELATSDQATSSTGWTGPAGLVVGALGLLAGAAALLTRTSTATRHQS